MAASGQPAAHVEPELAELQVPTSHRRINKREATESGVSDENRGHLRARWSRRPRPVSSRAITGAWCGPPGVAEQSEPVAVHNRPDVLIAVAPFLQQSLHLWQIGDGVQVAWRLLPPETTIQVGAERGVPAAASQLAHVVDVIDDSAELDPLVRRDTYSG